jgi:tetratricopeptide (TPR) repeat protein
LSPRKDAVSTESNSQKAQEQELWDRISTTEGAARAEVLEELSLLLYKRDSYTECLQVVETSIDIYYKSGGTDFYLRELIHVYEGKAFCLRNLKRFRESAETFEEIAKLHQLNNDDDGYIRARRAAACDWYEVEEWEKSLEGHTVVKLALNPDATPYSMGLDLLNIGMAHARLENHEAAIVSYLNARTHFKEAKNPEYVNWCDNYLAVAFTNINNGPEAKYYAQHYFNYSKVAEDLTMEGYARYRLGVGYLLCGELEEAETELTRALQLLTLEEDKDWPVIVDANKELAKALFGLSRTQEANTRLERIKTIEETIAA